jgi:glycosyltransferase involved in cell wall biosynthesis
MGITGYTKKALKELGRETLIIHGGAVSSGDKKVTDCLYIPNKNNFDFSLKTKLKRKELRFISKSFKSIQKLSKLPKHYKYYIVEAGHTSILLSKAIGLIKGKILIWVNTGLPFDLKFNKLNFILKHLLHHSDAFISIGKMNYEILSKFFPYKPNFLIYPRLVQKPKFRKVPKLNSHNILFFAALGDKTGAYLPRRASYKGADIIIRAFNLLKRQIPDLKLYVVGAYNNAVIDSLGKNKDILFLGYVKDIRDAIEKCSVAVNIGRGDAFPATSIETMYFGLPTIVSEYTGTKEIVEKVNKQFVSPLNPVKLAGILTNYFSLNWHKKLALSKASIHAVKDFYNQHKIKPIQVDYLRFIKNIDSK